MLLLTEPLIYLILALTTAGTWLLANRPESDIDD